MCMLFRCQNTRKDIPTHENFSYTMVELKKINHADVHNVQIRTGREVMHKVNTNLELE